MPGSSTTPGRSDLAMVRPKRVAFRARNSVGTRGLAFAAQWLAYALPYRRFVAVLADANARLGADVDRYSFIVVDLHHLLLAGRPAHFESSLSGRVGVKRFQTAPSILVLMSLAGILASLRDRHSGPPMMGSEGCGGPISRYVLAVRLTAGIKTRNGLASSIVPAGTSLHRVGGIQFSPIAIVHN